MKIRNRLAIFFTVLSAAVLAIVSLAVYYSSATLTHNEFFDRLSDRVNITEKLFLEKENLSEELYRDIREKFLHTLPEETEIVEETGRLPGLLHGDLKGTMPDAFCNELLEKGKAEFTEDRRQGMGRVYSHNGKEYAVIVIAEDTHGLLHLRDLRLILIFGFFTSIVLFFTGSRLFAVHALRPIAKKVQKAQTIGASNLHQRLSVSNKKDELGQLGIAFNQLLDRLETAFTLQKNFVRNASHEIRNPITSIIGEAEVILKKDRSTEEYKEALSSIYNEADRLNELVNNFLNLSKTEFSEDQNNQEDIRLDEVLLDASRTMDKTHPDHQLTLDFSTLPEDPSSLEMTGNANLLKVVFLNLMDNACKFSDNQPVTVSLALKGQSMCVTIKDKGIGISETDRSHIFQPLYRAENARVFKGTGIGLSLVDKIIQLHKGKVEVLSEQGVGTTVTVCFPVKSAAAEI